MTGGEARVRRFLRAGPAAAIPSASPGEVLLEAAGRGTIAVPRRLLAGLAEQGVVMREGESVRLAEGAQKEAGDALGAAARQVEVALAAESGEALAVNAAESPLALLARRKAKDGRPFLSSAEFQAGERLRADFTRGSLMPRLGANWVASVASGRRHAGSGIADLTDAALAARLRVEKAVAAVGPELAGVLVDVCCFLKGLEQVESERGWPVRSAKIVLKSALSALARHYDPRSAGGSGKSGILHWGAGDYRPKI